MSMLSCENAFAKGVDRNDIKVGPDALGIELDAHIENVLAALQEPADLLEL